MISAITKQYATRCIEDQVRSETWWLQLHFFTVNLEGCSPNLHAVQDVTNHFGTVHNQIYLTVQEGLHVIRNVINHIETYDITIIRAAIPMYLMSYKIKRMSIKIVLSSKGADEVFGGYLYFYKALNVREFHDKTVQKLFALHILKCAYANKAMPAWGVKTCVPFLDKKFLDATISINPKDKMCGQEKMKNILLVNILSFICQAEWFGVKKSSSPSAWTIARLLRY